MTDPIAASARATAQTLIPKYGPGLALDVEAALHARRSAQPPEQFLDPVSLGSLIVSIATLAWTIYADLKKGTPDPKKDDVAHAVQDELEARGDTDPTAHAQMIDVVVTEIIKAANDPR
jgi:hypothetical protein